MSNKNSTQHSEDKANQYLEETREYVTLLKNDLINKIISEQENKNVKAELLMTMES